METCKVNKEITMDTGIYRGQKYAEYSAGLIHIYNKGECAEKIKINLFIKTAFIEVVL